MTEPTTLLRQIERIIDAERITDADKQNMIIDLCAWETEARQQAQAEPAAPLCEDCAQPMRNALKEDVGKLWFCDCQLKEARQQEEYFDRTR